MTIPQGEKNRSDDEIRAIVNEMFDPSSADGLSSVVYVKMVEAVDFLMEHYSEIPVKIFKDYLFTVVEILDIKRKNHVAEEKKAIPTKLIRDIRSTFPASRTRRNLI